MKHLLQRAGRFAVDNRALLLEGAIFLFAFVQGFTQQPRGKQIKAVNRK